MKLFKEFIEDLELNEVLGKDADMGDYIDDFKKSDSPQFKGRSEKKRKEMAIAAYLSKQREETELDEGKMKKGDTVIVLSGPHKGVKHKIIHDFGDGTYNVSPIDLSAKQIKYRLGAAKAKASELKKEEVDEACWDGYKQVGMKKKGNKQVPNCVPEESKLGEGDPFGGPTKGKRKVVMVRHKTSGKELSVTANSVKKYEKMGYEVVNINKEYVNYPYGPLDTMRPMADLGDIPNYYGTKLHAQIKKKKVKRNA